MELVDAINILKFVAESDEEKEALLVLAKAAQNSGNSELKATYKQVNFIQSMAFKGEVDAMEEVSKMGISGKKVLRDLSKKEASKVIHEFKRRGYAEDL